MIRGDGAEQTMLARRWNWCARTASNPTPTLGPLFDRRPPDCDPEILKRLRQMYEAGGWVLVESALADLPADLRWLFESGAVTLEQLAAIHEAFGVTSAADLRRRRRRAVPCPHSRDSTPRSKPPSPTALPSLRASVPRIPLGRATAIAEPILERLRAVPGVAWALPLGSLRRGQDMVGDIEIVAAASDPASAIENCWDCRSRHVACIAARDACMCCPTACRSGVRLPEPGHAGASLLYLTGSRAHVDALRARASAAGWTLTAEGLQAPDGTLGHAASEEDIYAALGLPFIPPEIRDGDEEIAAASRGELPALVTRRDIRGDLHMHSMWSDGRDSIAAMVETCRALGYEYLAITDHSPHSAASRNLTTEGVKQQAEEIAVLREQYPDIAILHGCEVDILIDGRLDFPDKILERFDIVLASLHERAGHGPDQLMNRYASAMQHPLVTLITHPTNRLVPHRLGYDLDYDRLFETAVETGTVLEIDGAPTHLDLDGALARRAVAAGATVAIDSDCHRAELLDRQMHLGILTARRGWVEPRHVLNTRSIDEVRAVIAAKRGSR